MPAPGCSSISSADVCLYEGLSEVIHRFSRADVLDLFGNGQSRGIIMLNRQNAATSDALCAKNAAGIQERCAGCPRKRMPGNHWGITRDTSDTLNSHRSTMSQVQTRPYPPTRLGLRRSGHWLGQLRARIMKRPSVTTGDRDAPFRSEQNHDGTNAGGDLRTIFDRHAAGCVNR